MKFKKYFSATLIGLVALTACDGKENSTYEPADPTPAGQRVYFAKNSESFEVQDNSASVTVDIYRPESEVAAAQTVELEATDPSGLFTVPATVTIPAGEVSAPVEITYNWEALVEDETYSLDIAISEVNANQYAISSMKLSITRSNWTEWEAYPSQYKIPGLGYYAFNLLYGEVVEEELVLLTYRTNLKDPNNVQYCLNWLDDPEDENSWSTFMYFYSEDGGKNIIVPKQVFLVHPTYGPIYVSSLALFPGGASIATPSTFDPETGKIILNLIYWDEEGIWDYGDEYFQFYGYEDQEGDDQEGDEGQGDESDEEPEEGADENAEPSAVRHHSRAAIKAGRMSRTLKH